MTPTIPYLAIARKRGHYDKLRRDDMTDIVERLLSWDGVSDETLKKASDEITRLREANKELYGALKKIRDANSNAALEGYTDNAAVMALFECNQDATSALSKHKGELK